MASRGISAGAPCDGRDCPALGSPQKPDSPAAFLDSCRGYPAFGPRRRRVSAARVCSRRLTAGQSIVQGILGGRRLATIEQQSIGAFGCVGTNLLCAP
jgi:hypothetical protein